MDEHNDHQPHTYEPHRAHHDAPPPQGERKGPDIFFGWADGGPVPWPEMQKRMREAFREGFRPGNPEWKRIFRQFVENDGGNGEGGRRSNVLSLRVDDATLGAIDSLVEAGVFATRAESATWLLQAGVSANTELFNHIKETVNEIRRLRDELQQRMHAATGTVKDDAPVAPEAAAEAAPPEHF